MLKVMFDEEIVRDLLEKEIKKRVDEIAKEKYFLTYNELSEYLNLSKPTIKKNLITNGLKFYKVGSKYLFSRKEVDQFMDELTSKMDLMNNDFKGLHKREESK